MSVKVNTAYQIFYFFVISVQASELRDLAMRSNSTEGLVEEQQTALGTLEYETQTLKTENAGRLK